MSDYTPTTQEVRTSYGAAVTFPTMSLPERRRAFDRWLNEIRAEAWAEGKRARPLPTREQIAMAIAASHWDRDSGDDDVWHDLTLGEREAVAENYLTWDSADAVLALLKGQEK